MIRHRSEGGLVLADVLQQVCIVNPQAASGVERQSEIALVFMAQTWNLPGGRIVIHSFTGNEKCSEVQFLEPACTRLDAPKWLWERSHARKRAVIQRPKPHVIVAERMQAAADTRRLVEEAP